MFTSLISLFASLTPTFYLGVGTGLIFSTLGLSLFSRFLFTPTINSSYSEAAVATDSSISDASVQTICSTSDATVQTDTDSEASVYTASPVSSSNMLSVDEASLTPIGSPKSPVNTSYMPSEICFNSDPYLTKQLLLYSIILK